MNRSWIGAAIIGSLIVTVWMVIPFTVVPNSWFGVYDFNNPEEVEQVILKNAPKNGAYIINSDYLKKVEKSRPYYIFSAVKKGFTYRSPKPYIGAFILNILTALFILWLLSQTRGLTYAGKIGFISLIGLICGLQHLIVNAVLTTVPLANAAFDCFIYVSSWFLAGLAMVKMAKIVK